MTYRLRTTASAFILGLSGLMFASTANAAEYNVEINKTQILRLPGPASAVVIGNPQIADISVHSNNMLLINGRGYGETNIIVFDEFGQTMMDSDISVMAPRSGNSIRVKNIGRGSETYSCTPYCAPAPILGDDAKFVSQFEGETVTASSSATGTSFTPPVPEGGNPPAFESQR